MTFHRLLARVFFTAIVFLLAALPALAGDDWRPIDPGQLAMKEPVVEKDADAEAIFWEVRINDSATDLIFSHYIRIKVFTERGKESQSKIDLEYFGTDRITDVAGRTIKRDGTIVELKKDAIFDRTIVKAGNRKFKAKSFAMPAVEPGVIIEYRWKEVWPNQLANYLRLHFQREIPVQLVRYYVKPAELSGGVTSVAMSYKAFNGSPPPLTKDKDGFYTTSMTNMPAVHTEQRMPPSDQLRVWMLVFYSVGKLLPPAEYWPKLAKDLYEQGKPKLKVNDDIKKASAAAVGDATAPEQKLQRLFDFCRVSIKNINSDASGLTAADRAKLKANESPADTLKRAMGTGRDINYLFAALATAAGFDARIARLTDRSDKFFDQNFTDDYFLRAYNIAVRVGAEWKFFDPASSYIPFGMLRWQEEGLPALICDPKEGRFVTTPLSPAEKSQQKRTAALKLTEEGTIEGDVRIEYSGQFAAEKKENNDDDSPVQREENLRDMIKERMSTAELSNIKIENVTDPEKPFVYSFHVRVPGYAQRTGKRMFIQPAFFEKGIGTLFSSSARRHPVYFHYPWMEDDTVTIDLPSGFALDNADSPAPLSAGDVLDYKVKIAVVGKSEALRYTRIFKFSGLLFPVSNYATLKELFQAVHDADNHTITIKQTAASQ
ncbi:MAG TPA: DUF3857 domain-containing protein [Blastocatellia bacterium]|nr:DUF3857 domain-containing protein [Blastocatellia bacterium]